MVDGACEDILEEATFLIGSSTVTIWRRHTEVDHVRKGFSLIFIMVCGVDCRIDGVKEAHHQPSRSIIVG